MGDADAPRPPESFVHDCAELGFEIGGWDASTAGIFGHDSEFVGSHAEVMAFLRGWIACEMRSPRTVARFMLAMSVPTYESVAAPGQAFLITARPQRSWFRGERIAIPDDVARHFVINDIRVGVRSQFIQAGDLDGSLFAARIASTPTYTFDGPHRLTMDPAVAESIGRELAMDLCEAAMEITFTVTAKPTMPEGTRFAAMIIGTCPPPLNAHSPMVSPAARSAAHELAAAALEEALRSVRQGLI
jgi:hypothetical protein